MPDPSFDASIRVVIVDADHRVRESLADLLDLAGPVAVVGLAGHVGAAIRLVDTTSPDVVVLDPRLPDVDAGFALIALLRGRTDAPRVLVLTSLGCEVDVLARGADRFLPKNVGPQELVDAIVAVARDPGTSGSRPGVARHRGGRTSLRRSDGPLARARSLFAGPRLAPAWGAAGGRC